ncbi:MAG: hypothetical protein KGR16_01345 [Verrucomicrobia bacterium]|nr:hypothetical protein [Verrucomicrobiota bacterium]MDE3048078.1 hypothetical protein [Verrucomicrobiota bacterium]
MAKPIPEHLYERYLKILGWHLEKGGVDYNLYEGKHFLCAIKIIHAKGKKREVSPASVRKTERICEQMGLKWPPKKK